MNWKMTFDLGAALATAGTGIWESVGDGVTAALPVLIGITGIVVGMKLFRRFVKG